MKTILLTAMFAAGAAAQDPGAPRHSDPRVELAVPLAFEEQEGDLAKAETAYREALDGELSPQARWLANRRLGLLLHGLGRVEEAQQWLARADEAKGVVVALDDVTEELQGAGQDPEREAALREQARALVQRVTRSGAVHPGSPAIPGMDPQVAEQLLWIGAPAVPEILAALDAGPNGPAIEVLVRALWRLGGTEAEAYLAKMANGDHARTVAEAAAVALEADLRSPAARACLRHPDAMVAMAFLQSNYPPNRGGNQIVHSVPAAQLVELAEQGAPVLQAFVLRNLRRHSMAAEELARVHELVRRGLTGTDPDLGQAAEEFLTSEASQRSLTGVTMLLERLPALHAKGVEVDYLPTFREHVTRVSHGTAATQTTNDSRARKPVFPFGADAARTLVPKIDAAVAAIPRSGERASVWLYSCMRIVISALGRESVPHVLRWWDGGYEVWLEFVEAEAPALAPADVPDLFARYERVPEHLQDRFLLMFRDLEIPASLFEALRVAADAEQDAGRRKALGQMMVRTGRPEVVQWLVRTWRDAEGLGNWTAKALVEIGRRDTSAPVRDAMDLVVRGDGGEAPGGHQAGELLLAFLSTGDTRALDAAATWPMTPRHRHPYATGRTDLSPIQYVIYENPDPPHGFTEAQIVDTVQRFLDDRGRRSAFVPQQQSVPAIGDAALAAIAEVHDGYFEGRSWRGIALERLALRIEQEQSAPVLERWFDAALGGSDQLPARWFASVPEQIVDRYGARIEALLDGDDEDWARYALRALQASDRPIDLQKLLQNRHEGIRQRAANRLDEHPEVPVDSIVQRLADENAEVRRLVAEHLGAIVAKEAVPGLIGLLRDPSVGVREAAAQALTRIRFYHEQQAHWDRVLKGLDASPANAAEKLLLQAKPDAPKAQRLLAIQSLGVLGVPESLPFLIDWSNENDAEIAAAAKAAITKIHLEPRR